MKIKEILLQELYDAMNVNTEDLIQSDFKQTSHLRESRVRNLLNKWFKEVNEKNPKFKLNNRLNTNIHHEH